MFDENDGVSGVHEPIEHLHQLSDIVEMQARGGFVHDVQLPALRLGARDQFARDLEALRFAAGERRGRLPEAEIAEPHLLHLPEGLAEFLLAWEKANRFVHREVEYFDDALATHLDVEHVGLEAAAFALFARQVQVRHEEHLDFLIPGALALFAAATNDVEAERAGCVFPFTREGDVGKEAANFVERLDIGDRVRSRRTPDRLLIHKDHFVECFGAFEGVVRADAFAEVHLGAVFAGESLFERAIENVMNERALAATRYAGDRGERTERDAHIHATQVVLTGAAQRKPAAVHLPSRIGHGQRAFAAQVLAGERALRGGVRDRAFEDNRAAEFAATGPELDHPVRRADGLKVVLDHDHGVARVAEPRENGEQPAQVARMQSDARFVEDVRRVDEVRTERVGEGDALRFAAGEGARGAIEREVRKSDVAEKSEPVAGFTQNVRGDFLLAAREKERVEPGAQQIDGHGRDVGDGLAADFHVEGVHFQAGAMTGATLLGHLVAAQENPDVLLVLLRLQRLEVTDDAEKTLRLAAKERLALRRRERAPGAVERDPFAFAELRERAALVVVARHRPRVDGTVLEGALRVGDDQCGVVLQGGAEAVAGGAGPPRVVEREELRGRGRGDVAIVGAAELLRKR